MTNQELADWLNAQLALPAAETVTRDVIRAWVAWGVLPRATGRGQRIGIGRVWSRDDDGLGQARRLAALRQAGLRSEQALVSQMWLEQWPVEFQRARPALIAKFGAAAKRMMRGVTTSYDPRIHHPIPAGKQRAVINQIGPLAPIFANSQFAMTADETIASFAAARFGENATFDIRATAERILKSNAPNLAIPLNALTPGSPVGVLGDPEEIPDSARQSLNDSPQNEFELARRSWKLTRRFYSIFAAPAFRAFFDLMPPTFREMIPIVERIKHQIFIGDWAVLGFVKELHSIHLQGNDLVQLDQLISTREAEFNMIEESLEIAKIEINDRRRTPGN